MPPHALPDEETCRRAVTASDRRYDGQLYVGVAASGTYCRPSCPAAAGESPFFAVTAAARAARFRACPRCRPDDAPGSPYWRSRNDIAARAMRLIQGGEHADAAALVATLGCTPAELTDAMRSAVGAGPEQLLTAQPTHPSERQDALTFRLQLSVREPFDAAGLLAFLDAHLVAGVEERDGTTYRRTLRLPHGPGVAALTLAHDQVGCTLRLTDPRDLQSAIDRCRRMLDLDADPYAVTDPLGDDPALGERVRGNPGLRLPGAADGAEVAVRTVVGQQVSVAAARTVTARIVRALGEPLPAPDGGLTHVFPTAAAVAAGEDAVFAMPASRQRAVRALCAAIADGRVVLHPGVDRELAERALLALPGIGPWTASYIRLRALGDPDVFLPTDLAVGKALRRFAIPPEAADGWRPWRSYALLHLWTALGAFPTVPG